MKKLMGKTLKTKKFFGNIQLVFIWMYSRITQYPIKTSSKPTEVNYNV